MGKHYVPQYLLKGFEHPTKPGWIWMYDKQEGTRKYLPIKQVAQEADFYDPTDEKDLNVIVECPANPVIHKLRNQIPVSPAERKLLAIYMVTMIYRVPNARNMAKERAPKAFAETLGEHRAMYKEIERLGMLSPDKVALALAQLDAVEVKYADQFPPEVEAAINNPWPSWGSYEAILNMTWRTGFTKGPSFFLISDNPAYFFTSYGMKHPNAELILPISSAVVIHVSNKPVRQNGFIEFEQRVVKEFNRRNASGATRFVFYHKNEDWILRVANNSTAQLSRINWTD